MMKNHPTRLTALALLPAALAQGPALEPIHTFAGDSPGDRFGSAVAGAGDVNGDGFRDVLVGAPHADGSGASSGLARVFSGADGATLFTLEGDAPSDWLGFSVDGAGDVNGDGFCDWIAGSPLGTPSAGSAQLRSGRDGSLLFTWSGGAPGDRFGNAVCGAGDVNGDGFPDVAIGAPHGDTGGLLSGYVHVRSGADGALLHTLVGAQGDLFGSSLAAAGDANGDGFADLLVGAPLADGGAFNSGSSFVHSGSDAAVLHAFHGSGIGDQLGSSVDGAGDVDGDGTADFLLGAPGADLAGIDSGAAEVRSGAGGSALLVVSGSSAGEYLGTVAGPGDVDGDGLAEVLAGAASSDAGGEEAGTVRLVAGATGLDLAALHGASTFDWFGAALAAVGDVNGDGRPDFAVGAPGHDDVPGRPGYVQVFSTAPPGPSPVTAAQRSRTSCD